MGTIRSGLEELWVLQRHQEPLQPVPLPLEKPLSEWPVPQFISLFLPEFPMRPVRGQQELKILGLVAKGSFGTVLKVLDCAQKAVFAVKVMPKIKVLQRDTLRQCKEEVSIQRQMNHPFVHSLGDSWQGRRHLFINFLCFRVSLPSIAPPSSSFLSQSHSVFLQLLCQNPLHRLRYLHHFQVHPFFRGVPFDPELLKKQPVNLVMDTQYTSGLESVPFKDFDCDLESWVHSISADSLL
ncbi:cDNA sequence BC030499 [Cricetulus griseus]